MNKNLIIIILASFATNFAIGQVGMLNNSADKDAALDINPSSGAATKGLLLPKVGLQTLSSSSPMSTHMEGMHVYNTTDNAQLTPGEYYNDGSKWVKISSSSWSLTSNVGTNSATDAIGTSDNSDFAFRTGNTERMRVNTNGNVLIGSTTVPSGGETTKLSINNGTTAGALQIKDGTQGLGYKLTSDANGVTSWVNNASAAKKLQLTNNSNTPILAMPTPGSAAPGTTAGTMLTTATPIQLTQNGSYLVTLNWTGRCDVNSTAAVKLSANIQLLKNGVIVDEIMFNYMQPTADDSFTFKAPMLATNCVVNDVLSLRIYPSDGDMTTARSWYNWATYILLTKLN